MSQRIHLCSSPEPLKEGHDQVGLCGATVKKALFAFLFDEVLMGKKLSWINCRGLCGRCARLGFPMTGPDQLKRYVYGITTTPKPDLEEL